MPAKTPIIGKRKIKPFENIHIYPFINHILGVENPENIDGKTKVLTPILKK